MLFQTWKKYPIRRTLDLRHLAFFPRVPIEFLQKGFGNRYPKQYQQQQPPEAPAYKLSSSHPLHSHSSPSAL
ncbi:hypothetical protein I7I50_12289 [Histoplasma capsulatum G186AR]|nr:hypothetical protein I7I52_11398 [Histoplasma capsulatum]QSS70601.1 hypothetical protein I7I50_12289 [Histoplasma capsulatum G186AR]